MGSGNVPVKEIALDVVAEIIVRHVARFRPSAGISPQRTEALVFLAEFDFVSQPHDLVRAHAFRKSIQRIP